MALLAITSNQMKVIVNQGKPILRPLCKTNLAVLFPTLAANISGKAYRDPGSRPAPFPYKEKNYTIWRSWFDRTTDRFDENSKIIVVEGPIACGKTNFAKCLAEDLDMYHMPEANMDMRYINLQGYDMRQLDSKLPESVQSFDEKKFCRNPKHLNVAAFQIWMYRLRYSQYVDAIAHLLSTGQGVVLERCPWSDMVFVEAMRCEGFISREARKAYYEIKANTIRQLLRPHLVIYLDVPVEKVKEKIAKRGREHEKNSPALTDLFLSEMERQYKTKYLKDMSDHSELLMYDWSEPGDVEAVVEDIERIDFDKYDKHDEKLRDWCLAKEQNWADLRMRFADQKEFIMSLFNVPILYAPELIAPGEDVKEWNEAWSSAPGMVYEPGYDPSKDTGLLFKSKHIKYVPY